MVLRRMHKKTGRNADPAGQQAEAMTTSRTFTGWLEQLEGIYMHYYEKQQRAARKSTQETQGRHWQHYDLDS